MCRWQVACSQDGAGSAGFWTAMAKRAFLVAMGPWAAMARTYAPSKKNFWGE